MVWKSVSCIDASSIRLFFSRKIVLLFNFWILIASLLTSVIRVWSELSISRKACCVSVVAGLSTRPVRSTLHLFKPFCLRSALVMIRPEWAYSSARVRRMWSVQNPFGRSLCNRALARMKILRFGVWRRIFESAFKALGTSHPKRFKALWNSVFSHFYFYLLVISNRFIVSNVAFRSRPSSFPLSLTFLSFLSFPGSSLASLPDRCAWSMISWWLWLSSWCAYSAYILL